MVGFHAEDLEAALCGHASVAQLLLEQRANPDTSTEDGATPLRMAAAGNSDSRMSKLWDFRVSSFYTFIRLDVLHAYTRRHPLLRKEFVQQRKMETCSQRSCCCKRAPTRIGRTTPAAHLCSWPASVASSRPAVTMMMTYDLEGLSGYLPTHLSVYPCVYYIYIYTYTHTYTKTYICMFRYTYIHACIHTDRCTSMEWMSVCLPGFRAVWGVSHLP